VVVVVVVVVYSGVFLFGEEEREGRRGNLPNPSKTLDFNHLFFLLAKRMCVIVDFFFLQLLQSILLKKLL
jgi:hypothetical protein